MFPEAEPFIRTKFTFSPKCTLSRLFVEFENVCTINWDLLIFWKAKTCINIIWRREHSAQTEFKWTDVRIISFIITEKMASEPYHNRIFSMVSYLRFFQIDLCLFDLNICAAYRCQKSVIILLWKADNHYVLYYHMQVQNTDHLAPLQIIT